MPRRSGRGGASPARGDPGPAGSGAFVELLRPAAGRELVLEIEARDGVRVRVTLRDGGRWRLAGLEGPPGERGA